MDFEISLTGLQFYAYHGVMPQESKVGNGFEVSVSVIIEAKESIINDDLSSTISYADLYGIIKTEMEKPCKLLETVAMRIRNQLMATFANIKRGCVSITKNTPPIPGITGSATVKLNF